MTVLVTGAAGFIGHRVSESLLERGETVVGLDAVTDYYDVGLKEARISLLERHEPVRPAQVEPGRPGCRIFGACRGSAG